MYVYIQSEKSGWYPSREATNRVWLPGNLWTVGYYDPKGNWHPESDHETQESAANRVAYLNGQRVPA